MTGLIWSFHQAIPHLPVIQRRYFYKITHTHNHQIKSLTEVALNNPLGENFKRQ